MSYSVEEARAVRAMDIRVVVDDPEWQVVRKSLVGRWVRQHEANVAALRGYLDQHGWSPLAVRRVFNVLTGSVHRAGYTAGQASTDQLRKEVRIRWHELLGIETDMSDPRYALGVIGAGISEKFPK